MILKLRGIENEYAFELRPKTTIVVGRDRSDIALEGGDGRLILEGGARLRLAADGVSVKELIAFLLLTRQNLTIVLDRLEGRGWIEGVPPRLWLGNAIKVATHYDQMENIGIVVTGRRRFTLFPPEQVANLYMGPIELTPAGFYTKTTYIGAVSGSTDTLYQGWTCNSATLALGTSNTGACTSLPACESSKPKLITYAQNCQRWIRSRVKRKRPSIDYSPL